MPRVMDPHVVDDSRLSTFVHNLRGGGGDRAFGFRCPDGRLHVFVCDVAGKGACADAAANFLAQAVRMLVCQGMSLTLAMECLDLGFRHYHAHERPFASAFLANIEPGRLHYASAGHPDAYLVRHDGRHRHLASTGPLLGISESAAMHTQTISTSSSDSLAVVTDGFLDARRGGVRLGEAGCARIVQQALRESKTGAAATAVQRLLETVEAVDDDFAVLILALSPERGD